METARSTNRRKSIVKKAAVIFFIIVLLLTFFSKTINDLLMPEVESSMISRESLEKELDTTGEIKPLNTEKVSAWRNMRITEVRIKVGDTVSKGMVLVLAEKEDTLFDLKSLELEVKKAEDAYESFKSQYKPAGLSEEDTKTEWLMKDLEEAQKRCDEAKMLYENGLEDYKRLKACQDELDGIKEKIEALKKEEEDDKKGRDDYARGLGEREAELQLKRLELENFKKNSFDTGEVKSPVDGTVISVSAEKGSSCNSGQVLLEIAPKDSGYQLEWKLNTAKAELLKESDTLDFTVTGGQKMSFESDIRKKEYIPAEGMYLFTAVLDSKNDKLKEGQVEIGMTKRSKEYAVVVPNGCIYPSGEGKSVVFVLKQRDGILGEEYYVKSVEVEVLDSDDSNTAISGNLTDSDNIVSFTSKVLTDGVRVKSR